MILKSTTIKLAGFMKILPTQKMFQKYEYFTFPEMKWNIIVFSGNVFKF